MVNQNTYRRPAPQGWRGRAAQYLGGGMRNGVLILPQWFSRYPIVLYIIALLIISFLYSTYSMPWYYMLSGVISVLVFFAYGNFIAKKISIIKIKKEINFEKRIFLIAFGLRALFMFLIYWIFMENYGDSFGFEGSDAQYYDDLGVFVAQMLEKGEFNFYDAISEFSGNSDIADMGYGVYVGLIYWLTGSGSPEHIQLIGEPNTTSALSILSVRMLKCILSSITVLFIYRIAKRNFDEQIARIAAIFCALWPNFWYYCGTHLKEVEMAFLVVLFVGQADQMLKSKQFTAWKVIPVLLLAAAMFTFRTALGLVALLALLFSIVVSSSKVVSWGKRIIIGLLAIALIGVIAGNRIQERTQRLVAEVQSNEQEKNMEWRSQRDNGNSFAKYAGAAVFAPMIFTLPFPTMVKPFEGQDLQQLLNGSNFVKNCVSFFTIFAMIVLLISGKWRDHLLPLSFMLGYLVVLALSTFAHSERFHQPVMPLEFMFVAYGLSVAVTKKRFKRWFNYWTVLMFIAALAWNWFKLKGRGMI